MRGAKGIDWGSFGLTEVGHGSNVRGIETTATFDPDTNEFVLNSPTTTSAKFWIGSLGKTSTRSVIWAQLVTPDGVSHGPHAFVVKVRDEQNHLPVPGCDIGDCGLKIGLDPMDNGWVRFYNCRIPKDCLLNRLGDVTPEGKYVSPIESDGKRFGMHFNALGCGRVIISRLCVDFASAGLVPAIRYGLVRRQFGEPGNERVLMDYPLHQFRLIPLYAENLSNYFSYVRLSKIWIDNIPRINDEKNKRNELCHGLSSAAKAFNSWSSNKILNESRRAMGGIGYSIFSNILFVLTGDDVDQTLEGDNDVLIQQTAKFILRNLQFMQKGKEIMETCEYLTIDYSDLDRFIDLDYSKHKTLLKLFQQRACESAHRVGMKIIMDFSKWDSMQPYDIKEMAESYYQYYQAVTFSNFLKEQTDPDLIRVFEKLHELNMLMQITRASDYYRSLISKEQLEQFRLRTLDLCQELRPEIFALTQVLPYPNGIFSSVGTEDLQPYGRLLSQVKTRPGVHERPEWWQMIYQNQ